MWNIIKLHKREIFPMFDINDVYRAPLLKQVQYYS